MAPVSRQCNAGRQRWEVTFDEVVARAKYDLTAAGLREQIEIDRRAIAREWARENTDLNVILCLLRHVEYCEGRL